MGVTRIESNRNRHFGLKIESKSIENRNLEIVTSLYVMLSFSGPVQFSVKSGVAQCSLVQLIVRLKGSCTADLNSH